MASKVQICNIALSRLGADRITSITDNTVPAKLCNTFYDNVVEEVLLEGEWSQSINRATLAKTANTPVYEYSYEYQLPTDPVPIRILEINETEPGSEDYSIEKDKLLIDLNTVSIRYIGVPTDPQSYGPALTNAVISRLTAELAYPLTGQSTISDRLHQKYERDLVKYLAMDGKQGSKEEFITNTLTGIR